MGKIVALILVAALLAGCSAAPASLGSSAPEGKEIPGLTWESGMELEYATEFAVDYYAGGYALIEVIGDCRYLVVPEGREVPEGLDGSIKVLQQPLDTIYLQATSAMALFDRIDGLGSIRLVGTRKDGWYVENARFCVAYRIAQGACPELERKELLPVPMPMTKDPSALERSHEAAANAIAGQLEQGRQVAFVTLGDPTVYSTYLYIHRKIAGRGYETAIVSGIPSFCAAAARLNQGLAEQSQPLHILPGTYHSGNANAITALRGTKVLMKTGKNMARVRGSILESGQEAVLVENCGMPGEAVYHGAASFLDNPSYYSLIIVKE